MTLSTVLQAIGEVYLVEVKMNEIVIDVHVTQPDIDGATHSSVAQCPIARSIRREYPEFNCIRVSNYQVIAMVLNVGYAHADLPVTAVDYVRAFDTDEYVMPINFRLTFVKFQ